MYFIYTFVAHSSHAYLNCRQHNSTTIAGAGYLSDLRAMHGYLSGLQVIA